MRAIHIENPGPESRLVLTQRKMPLPGPGEVRLRVAYAGVNRADLFQRRGQYRASDTGPIFPGLEVSGLVEAHGEGVDKTIWPIGAKVCAVTNGGHGYSDALCLPTERLLPVPKGWSLADAAAIPEAMMTVWHALMDLGAAQPGDWVVIQGGSSGIGSVGIPMLAMLGIRVVATARDQAKCDYCWSQGAEAAFPSGMPDLVSRIRETTGGGARAVLDMLGGTHLGTALKSLAHGGHLISIAFLNKPDEALPLGAMLLGDLHWHGMMLRNQTAEKKVMIVQALRARVWPELEMRDWRPVIDSVFPLEEAEKAQNRMEERLHLGKILLKVGVID